MEIVYYGLAGCELTQYDGKDALRAPEGAEEAARQHRFLQMPDGRWYLFLTGAESEYIRSFPEGVSPVHLGEPGSDSGKSAKPPVWIPVTAAALYLLCILTMFTDFLSGIPLLFLTAATGLSAFYCIRFPRSKGGKLLVGAGVTISIVMLVITIAVIAFCVSMWNQCLDECTQCQGMG